MRTGRRHRSAGRPTPYFDESPPERPDLQTTERRSPQSEARLDTAPVDAAGWEGLGALYYKLGAAVLVWDAERCEERLAAQIAGASNTSDSGALSGQGGDPK